MEPRQVVPDWSERCRKSEFARKYNFSWTYEREGLYLSPTDTVLIQEDGDQLYVHCWNCTLSDTLLAETWRTRVDDRPLLA